MEYLRFVSIVTASSVQAVHLDRVFVLVMKKNAWANLETIWSSYNQSKARYQDYLLLPKKLTHPSFPSTTLVLSHTPVLWAPPRKPSALTPEYVNKLLLGPILHLTAQKLISPYRSIPHSELKHPASQVWLSTPASSQPHSPSNGSWCLRRGPWTWSQHGHRPCTIQYNNLSTPTTYSSQIWMRQCWVQTLLRRARCRIHLKRKRHQQSPIKLSTVNVLFFFTRSTVKS